MKMFSASEDYEEVESTGYESYGEAGYSSPFAHWLEDYNEEDNNDSGVPHFRD